MADSAAYTGPSDTLDVKDALWGPYWISPLIGAFVTESSAGNFIGVRTTDGGANWVATTIMTAVYRNMAVFFDREVPGDAGTLLHIVGLDDTGDAFDYRTFNVSDATLGTQVEIANTLAVSGTGDLDRCCITKTRNGNLIAGLSTQTVIDCFKSDDDGATWTGIADVYETATEEDFVLLFPANTDDGADACAIFWDRSADEMSIKMWDDSAGTWTETSISGSMIDKSPTRGFDASTRHSDGHILLAAFNEVDGITPEIKTWDITPNSIASPTITAKTDVTTNVQAGALAIIINQQNDAVYVGYLKGQITADVPGVFHVSTDGMATWGSEQAYTETNDDYRMIAGGRTIGLAGGRIQWTIYDDDEVDVNINLVNDVEIAAGTATAAVTGTAGDGTTETLIRSGGQTIIITLTSDTWLGATFDAIRQDIIDGLDSAQSEATGWNAEVRDNLATTTVVRTSDRVVTITLSAQAAYDITANETITVTVPATAVVGGAAITASPTFLVTRVSGGGGGGGGQGGGGGGNSGGGGGGNPGGGPPGQGGGGPPGQGGGKGDRFFMSNLRRRRKQFVGF